MSRVTPMSSEFVFIYTPLPDEAAAGVMAEALIRQRLAVCVNIYPQVMSVYEWKGEVQKEREAVAWIKTRTDLIDEVLVAAKLLHPYEVPAFLVIPIEGGNEDYFVWARGQVK